MKENPDPACPFLSIYSHTYTKLITKIKLKIAASTRTFHIIVKIKLFFYLVPFKYSDGNLSFSKGVSYRAYNNKVILEKIKVYENTNKESYIEVPDNENLF